MTHVVAAAVFCAYYQKISSGPSNCSNEDRAMWIRYLREGPRHLGCEKPEEVDDFADLWVSTISERNTAAHEIGAQHVITILPYCEPKLQGVLRRAFGVL